MKTDELRQKFLEFFAGKDHRICASDVLVPRWDETVLFTPAGMNQFKDHFLGNVELEFTRATSCQKCLRTGDINNVGRTAYHHTFFEMLGNFSFGDYFKREAINWAWEFLTDPKWLGIDSDRLTVTIYLDDDEAAEIWSKDIGLSSDRITREGEDENFWPAEAPSKGPDGVCGPCSEIYYTPDDGKKVEIWNLVFTQFNRCGPPPDNLQPLPSRNIDTGMGLERCAAVLQGVETNYHIDILRPLVEAAGEICRAGYDPGSDQGRRLRRIADHIRACTFAIHENTNPGPKAENSVIRMLVRRAFLDGYQLGMREAFLYQLVPTVTELMKPAYPELTETIDRVQNTLKAEEDGFLHTVESGMARVMPLIEKQLAAGSKSFPGQDLFVLKTTHGVPEELTEKLALDAGLQPDIAGFEELMRQHGDRSNTGETGVMGGGPMDTIKNEVKRTTFLGYELEESPARIVGIVADGKRQQTIHAPSGKDVYLVLDQTPFYAESGGQVGDTGIIESDTGRFEVSDTRKDGEVFVHVGQLVSGTFAEGDSVTAKIDSRRRQGIRRAHSATHILHYALQKHVSRNAHQQGSKVEDDWLRFDYSNAQPVPEEQLIQIEQTANQCVEAAAPIEASTVSLEEARAAGAMMLFGEKYPDPCRMVSMGDFSKELCGGTHLNNTSEVGLMEIRSESSLAAGVRRIEVLTGDKARQRREQIRQQAIKCADLLSCDLADLPAETERLIEFSKQLRKQLDSGKPADIEYQAPQKSSDAEPDFPILRSLLRKAALVANCDLLEVASRIEAVKQEIDQLQKQLRQLKDSGGVSPDELIERADDRNGISVIAAELPGGNPNLMRTTIDQIRKKKSPVAVLLAARTGESKVLLVAGISKELVDQGYSAGDWIKKVAPLVGGGGGGKPDMAQAGGKNPEKIEEALATAPTLLEATS